jgi:hypothetical protein
LRSIGSDQIKDRPSEGAWCGCESGRYQKGEGERLITGENDSSANNDIIRNRVIRNKRRNGQSNVSAELSRKEC